MIAVAKLPTMLFISPKSVCGWRHLDWNEVGVSDVLETDCAALFPLKLFRQPVLLLICLFCYPHFASAPIVLEGVHT